jgi:hypothetical protein
MDTMSDGREALWTDAIRRSRLSPDGLPRPCPRAHMRMSSGVPLRIRNSPLSPSCPRLLFQLVDPQSLLTLKFLLFRIPMMAGKAKARPSTRSSRAPPALLILSPVTALNRPHRLLYLFLHVAPMLDRRRRREAQEAATLFRLPERARALVVEARLSGRPIHRLLRHQHPNINIRHLRPLVACITSPRLRPQDETPFGELAKIHSLPYHHTTPLRKALSQFLHPLMLISIPTRERTLPLLLIIIRQTNTADGHRL